ncbi:MAG: serine protein kinase PrkA [Desulfobacterales bacterium]|nr:serine protein kinase PrkA [Desulfobacterales bacterium]MDD4393543.1 serine protein kinase PrkA [Desulfobacterales bacterium]
MNDNVRKAMQHLNQSVREHVQLAPVAFEDFVKLIAEQPDEMIRNVFQLFHDMIKTYVTEDVDEYPNDPETVHYASYDCSRLFVTGSDHPFFADRLFANRLVNLAESFRRGAQQNKIYIFEGPPGSGKSTFLNNLLRKFEEYVNSEQGLLFETVWRLNRKLLGTLPARQIELLHDHVPELLYNGEAEHKGTKRINAPPFSAEDYIEIPCPSHDHPVLMIPKQNRHEFLENLFSDQPFRTRLINEKEYDWVFRDKACTICSSLYQTLLYRLKSPADVFRMIFARPYQFNRRLGQGISVFTPGDKRMEKTVLSNEIFQKRIDEVLEDSNRVKYVFSRYAKTNNGIYALMDIKSNNTDRLIELHNIISEGVHKVEDIEENVNSLFLALMNPEDKKNIQDFQSFSDRIEYINIPYILDLRTEVEIYRHIFGGHIDQKFLPRVLHNFARVIISSRLNTRSEALLEWIGNPHKYRHYCDENLQLLKMEIYTGYIPKWLTEEDRKRLTARLRRKILSESETEGAKGFSGRDSIKIFNMFYSPYAKLNKPINMSMMCRFFTKTHQELNKLIPEGFLDSLLRMYNYTVLQEVKESLYYYNEEQISKDIQNYMFAVNFETGSKVTCKFTKEKLNITDDFFDSIENRILGAKANKDKRLGFRGDTQKVYASNTLTQEIMLKQMPVTETTLYHALHERYVYNLKEKVLDPFLENENFRNAIKDYGKESFKTYDRKIQEDVLFLINNLCSRYRYTERGANEVCMYVIDNDLAGKFLNP